jgi:hypothetical protein
MAFIGMPTGLAHGAIGGMLRDVLLAMGVGHGGSHDVSGQLVLLKADADQGEEP